MNPAEKAASFVLPAGLSIPSDSIAHGLPHVVGPDFNQMQTLDSLLATYRNFGFQATNMSLAIDRINEMLHYAPPSLSSTEQSQQSETGADEDESFVEKEYRAEKKPACTIFLGYTSNMASCGMREVVRFLVQHKLVDVVVASAGGIEEDFIKCLAPTLVGDFKMDGKTLRKQAMNRIGNLIVPNSNYCLFEDWIMPIFDRMYDEQEGKEQTRWTPSKVIERLGHEIKNEESIYYWCAKNKIPVFCPALTDGSLGDMLYFHSYKKDGGLRVDLVEDIRKINNIAVWAKCSGMIIIGGGVIKHHICNANLMRNGADFSVFINTGQEFDGSDSGAAPDEAVSWGKIKMDAKPVKVVSDATLVFPLIVSQTFAKFVHEGKKRA
eukprot:ANDGO_05254.mRNA.1 putative deoxyhypusine synthase